MSNSIYSNARAKALFNYLLNNDKINRMIDSKNADEALKILTEINFGDGLFIDSVLDFEFLISKEQIKLYDFIRSTSPSKGVTDYFLLKNDYHNAEAFIKEKYLKIDVSGFLKDDGTFKKDYLKECIMTDDYKRLPEEMSIALYKSDEAFVNGNATGSFIGSLFEKAYFKNLSKAVKNDKILSKILKVKIDCINVGVSLRLRNYSNALDMFLDGGEISANELKSLCEDSFDILKEKFKFSEIGDIIVSAINSAEKGEPLSEFEKNADDYAVKYLSKFKYSTEGNLPYIEYCFYKLADIFNVRVILVGLINKLSSEKIRSMLRLYYEG